MGPDTRLFISVSSTPGIFGATVYNELFRRRGIDAVYLPKKSPISALGLCEAIRVLDVSGCSVSAPLKAAIVPYLDELDEMARATASVNTVVKREGRLLGYNTDVDGVLAAVRSLPRLPGSVEVYGTGGVVSSVLRGLRELGVSDISLSGRRADAVQALCAAHGVSPAGHCGVDLLINATTAATPDDAPGFNEKLALAGAVFDLRVARKPGDWVDLAGRAGKSWVGGLTMAKGQLIRQFHLYTGQSVEREELDEIVGKMGEGRRP